MRKARSRVSPLGIVRKKYIGGGPDLPGRTYPIQPPKGKKKTKAKTKKRGTTRK